MADSIQHKIGRNRPPRVQITYDVEIGDAMEVKELPFVVGMMADLAGQTPQPKLKERKFVQIDGENFDEVLSSYSPSLSFTVPNQLDNEGEHVPVELKFERMGDFEPMAIVDQVPKLRDAYKARQQLNALLAKIYVNDDLASALNDVIQSSNTDEDLKKALEDIKSKLG